jgi:signal transduction histidine kinase
VLVDRAIPVFAGALFGVSIWAVRLRAAALTLERERARRLDERLRKIERDQAVFVIAAATLHELKNPLHALGLLLEELEQHEVSVSDGAALLARARANTALMRDRLEVLRSLAGGACPSRTRFVPRQIADELAETLGPRLARDGIELRVCGETLVAEGDPSWAQIALENMIGNAQEALAERGQGHIEIAIERDGDRARVLVSDDGPGLSRHRVEEIFEPLASSKPHGLGLGLPIARGLARAMGGDVAVTERPGWSTTFALQLPESAT